MIRAALALALALLSPLPLLAQEAGSVARGRDLARAVCAGCHAVEPGEGWMEAPPPLPFEPGVILPFGDIANTPGVTGRALHVWLTSSHPTMPDIMLERGQIEDVVAYILSLRDGAGGDGA